MKRIFTILSQKWPEFLLEIIVITIGILGAFALNSWNENRKDRIKEQQVIGQLISDYESNLAQLEEKMAMRESMIKAARSYLNAIDNPEEANHDSLASYLALMILDPTYEPISNDLISSGNIRLIKNDTLRLLLSNWSSVIGEVLEMEFIWQKTVYEQLDPHLNEIGLGRNVINRLLGGLDQAAYLLESSSNVNVSIGDSKNVPSLEEISRDTYLEGLASLCISYNYISNIQSQALRKRIFEILELLNEELQDK